MVKMRITGLIVTPLAVIAVLLLLTQQADACFTRLTWAAVLAGSFGSAPNSEAGSAQMQFDPVNPYGTLTVVTHNVRNVRSIQLRLLANVGDRDGETVASIYSASDGPYRGSVKKLLTMSNVVARMHRDDFGVLDAMTHNKGLIVVCTDKHPNGEISGIIGLRPIVVYSDGPGQLHDPKLHKAHEKESVSSRPPAVAGSF